nr:reverse transcriptase domain-containing protein [Tanacetum cinerariifolium]
MYVDVFAWTTAHMMRVPRTETIGEETFNTEHRINELKHLEPVKQKKRSLAPERNKAIHIQVEELTKANILREVKYQTWVSNPVIVKNAVEDESCATYQRLIDKVFNHQLGRNMEVNAGDIVIKSDVEEEMLADIKETLNGLRAINLKLNPKKCSFGVEEGIFSRHLITKIQSTISGSAQVKEIRVQELTIFIDSQLVANQVNGLFEARQTVIKQYIEKANELLANFLYHSIGHIKRDQNKKADALSKMASMTFSKLSKEVLVEVIQDKSITQKEVANITQEKEDSWMIPIREYLQFDKLLDDPQKARKPRIKTLLYRIMDGKLYRRSYVSPWLRCVGETQAKRIIQKVHQGSCGMHAGPRSVVSKIIRLGYYWSSMHKDAKGLIWRCETCQIHSPIPKKLKQEMTSIMSTWPLS